MPVTHATEPSRIAVSASATNATTQTVPRMLIRNRIRVDSLGSTIARAPFGQLAGDQAADEPEQEAQGHPADLHEVTNSQLALPHGFLELLEGFEPRQRRQRRGRRRPG